jgi:hypothetical protein
MQIPVSDKDRIKSFIEAYHNYRQIALEKGAGKLRGLPLNVKVCITLSTKEELPKNCCIISTRKEKIYSLSKNSLILAIEDFEVEIPLNKEQVKILKENQFKYLFLEGNNLILTNSIEELGKQEKEQKERSEAEIKIDEDTEQIEKEEKEEEIEIIKETKEEEIKEEVEEEPEEVDIIEDTTEEEIEEPQDSKVKHIEPELDLDIEEVSEVIDEKKTEFLIPISEESANKLQLIASILDKPVVEVLEDLINSEYLTISVVVPSNSVIKQNNRFYIKGYDKPFKLLASFNNFIDAYRAAEPIRRSGNTCHITFVNGTWHLLYETEPLRLKIK